MQHRSADAVNPYAGSYPITADPQELEAARRAAETSLREFPYYLERYGERGRLFGTSDGAWLVTLCEHEAAVLREQVLWLGRVLSARGMPRLLLERHLEVLHEELARRVPARAERCEPLRGAAVLLRDLRQEQIPERDFRALSAAFAERAGAEWAERLPRMGEILVAAVADEAGGIAGAVKSVRGWAVDPARFPSRWIDAVNETLRAGQGAVRSEHGAVPGAGTE